MIFKIYKHTSILQKKGSTTINYLSIFIKISTELFYNIFIV